MSLRAILDILSFLYTPCGLPDISQRFLILIFDELLGNLFNFNWAANLSANSNDLSLIIFLSACLFFSYFLFNLILFKREVLSIAISTTNLIASSEYGN